MAESLNDGHQGEIVNYLRFARYNRGQRLRSIEGCFQDIKDTRLLEDTYTFDEVSDIIEGLDDVVKLEVELELTNAAHTNVLLLRQLFCQAEKWHLKLQVDVSELENRKLLDEIAKFEENEFSVSRAGSSALAALPQKKLEPLNESGSTALLQMEINRLNEDNTKLRERVQMLEKKASGALEEKNKLRSDLDLAKKDIGNRPQQKGDGKEIQDLTKQMTALSQELVSAEEVYKKKAASKEEELANTKHYVLALQNEVENLSQELEMKFNETTTFRNLKRMLETKNSQIRELRSRLRKHEPDVEI